MPVSQYLINDGSSWQQTINGQATLTHVHLVPSDEAGSPANPGQRIIDAGVNPTLPLVGQQQAWGQLIYEVVRKTSRPVGNSGDCLVTVEWQLVNTLDLQYGSSLQSERTNIAYNPASGLLDLPITTTHEGETQGHLIDLQRPEATIRTTRTENFVDTGSPLQLQRAYVGKVNSTAWPPATLDAPRSWLCTRIETNRVLEFTFEVSYEFAFRDRTWDVTVVHQVDGQPIENPTVAEGSIKQYRVYQETDFSALGLLIP